MWHLHAPVLSTWFQERTKLKGMDGIEATRNIKYHAIFFLSLEN
jgi:hypothetical protein